MIFLMMWICLLNCTCRPDREKPGIIAPRPRRVGGDPHYTTWSGTSFSYHGQCDIVLAKSDRAAPGAGIHVHVRTQIRDSYSFVKAVAVRVNSFTFEMEGKDKFHINGEPLDRPPSNLNFGAFKLTRVRNAPWCKKKCSNAVIYRISLDADDYVEVVYWAEVLHVEFNGKIFEDSTGLLGSKGFVDRKGNLITKVNDFGQEWQVKDSDPKIFTMQEKKEYCVVPKVAIDPLRESKYSRDAKRACSHVSGDLHDMCIFDVIATGNVDIALSPIYMDLQ